MTIDRMVAHAQDAAVFLGIEAGATRCVAICADWRGGCLRRIEKTEPANLRLLDENQLLELLRMMGRQVPRPTAVGIGMAGVLDHSDRTRVRNAAAAVWPEAPLWVGNDLETVLAVANARNQRSTAAQVIIVSGTGAACYGRKRNGEEVLTGGWGQMLGDRGSGYNIALQTLQAVFRELDEKGCCSALGQRLFAKLQANSASEAAAVIGRSSKAEIAALAIEVFESAGTGDKIAKRILSEAAASIAETASACARRLVGARKRVEFILNGSVLIAQPHFALRVKRLLCASWPGASVRMIRKEGVWGAVLQAQQLSSRAHQVKESITTADMDEKCRQLPISVIAPGPVRIHKSGLPIARGLSPTEQRNPRSKRLDKMSVSAAIRLMLSEEALVPGALLKEERTIAKVIAIIVESLQQGGRLIYVGAGTSGRLGLLDAFECPPTFGVAPARVQAILAGGERALQGSFESEEDDFEAGASAAKFRGISKKDVVIGIAASGRTPFVWGALHAARELGAKTVLVCFNPRLQFSKADRPTLVVTVQTGPEVLTGSTRLKAGTATKLLLNMFSTLAMVRLGKVVENLMVNVQASNSKLRDRALRVVQELTGVKREVAEKILHQQSWSIKQAIARLRSISRRRRPSAKAGLDTDKSTLL